MTGNKKQSLTIILIVGLGLVFGLSSQDSSSPKIPNDDFLDKRFPIKKSELTLRFAHQEGARRLSFRKFSGAVDDWKVQAKEKLAELLGFSHPEPCKVRELRQIQHQGVTIHALIMTIDENLTIPGYLLEPPTGTGRNSAVMAIHGHGSAEPCIGQHDDYHHLFALELAKHGHLVLCPELRGFSTLNDLAYDIPINRLDYWIGRYSQFTLVTDGFLYGKTLIGETVEDLLRWEEWFSREWNIDELDVAGISYGGDLCLVYPVFSKRIRRIFASGTLGSFSLIFQRCYNAPAHCIPGILEWMDRSDIAGLNAPRPIVIHYGEQDVPGLDNASASYNESVPQSMEELKSIYRAFNAEKAVKLIVTVNRHHEMDIPELLKFLKD